MMASDHMFRRSAPERLRCSPVASTLGELERRGAAVPNLQSCLLIIQEERKDHSIGQYHCFRSQPRGCIIDELCLCLKGNIGCFVCPLLHLSRTLTLVTLQNYTNFVT